MILLFLKHRTCANAEHGELPAKSMMLRSFQCCLRERPPVFTRDLWVSWDMVGCPQQDE